MKLLRDGKEVNLEVKLGRLEVGEQIIAAAEAPPATPGADTDEPVGPPPGLKDMVGLDLAPIDDAARRTYSLSASLKGLVITEVTKGSDAEKQGLIAGLIVSEVNQQKIETVADVDREGECGEGGRAAGGAVQGDRPDGRQPFHSGEAELSGRCLRRRSPAGRAGP